MLRGPVLGWQVKMIAAVGPGFRNGPPWCDNRPVRPGLLVPAALGLGLAACTFDVGFDGTRYRCGVGDRCPPGTTCVDGFCVATDAGPDAGDPDGGPGAACGTLDLLRDAFDTPGSEPYFWSFADTGAAIGESGGHLVIDVGASALAYAGYTSAHAYDLRGGAIEATVTEVGVRSTILEVRNHVGGMAQLAHEDGEVYAAIYDVPGEGTLAQRLWDPAERHWRIREDQGDMVWEVSRDRQSWSELHRRTLPFDVAHVRGILAAGGTSPAAGRSRFDDVNLAAPARRYCAVAELRDDFTGGSLWPVWESYADSGCTIAPSGGALVMSYPSGSGVAFCGMSSSHLWDLSEGDGVVIAGAGFPTVSGFVSYLQLARPGDDRTRAEITLEGTSLAFQVHVDDVLIGERTLTIDRTAHAFWRIRGDGGAIVFETSADRAAWAERLRVTAPAGFPLAPVVLHLGAGHYQGVAGPLTVTVPGLNAD